MQAVGHILFPKCLEPGLHTAAAEGIPHRDAVVARHFLDGIGIVCQAAHAADAQLVIIGLVLAHAVQRSHNDDLGIGIALVQLFDQQMVAAVEGVCPAVEHGAHGSVAVTKVIGATEDDDHIGIGDHAVYTGSKILILVPVRLGSGDLLHGNAGAADAIAVNLRTGHAAQGLPIGVFQTGSTVTFRDAVAQKGDLFTF